jgi:hypothetical protein
MSIAGRFLYAAAMLSLAATASRAAQQTATSTQAISGAPVPALAEASRALADGDAARALKLAAAYVERRPADPKGRVLLAAFISGARRGMTRTRTCGRRCRWRRAMPKFWSISAWSPVEWRNTNFSGSMAWRPTRRACIN